MDVIDFNKYKEEKEVGSKLEKTYQDFLTHTNKFMGMPTTFSKVTEMLYYVTRYLEGTINAASILNTFKLSEDYDVDSLKEKLITWLESIIEEVKEI